MDGPHMTDQRAFALTLLAGVFSGSLVTANLIGSKLVMVGGFTVSAGILVFPLTFLVCDIVSELFGPKTATNMVWTGLFVQVIALVIVEIGGLLPPSPRRDLSEAYAAMYSLTPRMVLASITAYTISQLIDVRLFHAIRRRTEGRHFWLRKNVSTLVGQAIDTVVFMTIFLAGVLPAPELMKAMVPPFLLKTLLATLDTPLMYAAMKWVGKSKNASY